MSFSAKLKELRLQSNLSQEQLSRKLDILRRAYIYYETGHKYPSVEVLIRIAKFFNVSIDFLMDEQDDAQTQNLFAGEKLSEFTGNDLHTSFSENLKELRLRNNLSQEKMSRKLDIVTSTYIYYETGKRLPSIDLLTRIAKIFKVSISFLINEQGEYTVEIQGDITAKEKNE